ncbi:MAG: cytochrome-c oxidase, cbb3-type subunit II [Xanthomonadales bacterium]|nr:cytochrome-c oxidase, cbb3-type subunit II [Xanthomonadales bacterium]
MSGIKLHQKLENNAGLLIFGILFVASIGGAAQVMPALFQDSLADATETTVPYSPVELMGRDIYIRESCSVCHTQHVRPLLAEVERYGPYSRAGEFVYDRPFLWGSKRTGPDLARLAGKYSDEWHRLHLLDPRALVPASIMPAYPWLEDRMANADGDITLRLETLRKLGHPYTDDDIAGADAALEGVTEMDALIAYLQSLGRGYQPGSDDEAHGGH